jgi:hypothetical protein
MSIQSEEASLGEVVVSPDPRARAKAMFTPKVQVAIYVVLALLVLFGILLRHHLNWGDVSTWVLAITTLLAFLAAAFAGLVAYDLLKVENVRDIRAVEERSLAAAERRRAAEERAAQRDADLRAQASKVTAWFNFFEVIRSDRFARDPQALVDATWGGTVQNSSELPIFDVRIFYYWVNDRRDGSPWTTEQRYASVDIIRVIPPGQIRNQELPERVRNQSEECNDRVYLVGIEFTDANGRRWFRNERAVLEPR